MKKKFYKEYYIIKFLILDIYYLNFSIIVENYNRKLIC